MMKIPQIVGYIGSVFGVYALMVAIAVAACPKIQPASCKCSLPANSFTAATDCNTADGTNNATCVALKFRNAKDGKFTSEPRPDENWNVKVAPATDKVDCYDEFTCTWYPDTDTCGWDGTMGTTEKSPPQKIDPCP